jgi:hypothetical protein
VKVLPNTVGSGRSSDSPISTTVVSGRVNVVKGLKRTVQLHMLGFGEVDIWLVQKRLLLTFQMVILYSSGLGRKAFRMWHSAA